MTDQRWPPDPLVARIRPTRSQLDGGEVWTVPPLTDEQLRDRYKDMTLDERRRLVHLLRKDEEAMESGPMGKAVKSVQRIMKTSKKEVEGRRGPHRGVFGDTPQKIEAGHHFAKRIYDVSLSAFKKVRSPMQKDAERIRNEIC